MLFTVGASAAATNLRRAARAAEATRPRPYQMTCGANISNIHVPSVRLSWATEADGSAAVKSHTISGASTIASTASNARYSPSIPATALDERSSASSPRSRRIWTKVGTSAACRAPPASSSNSTLGTVLTVSYRSPSSFPPSTAKTTKIRTIPVKRDTRVSAVMIRASRATRDEVGSAAVLGRRPVTVTTVLRAAARHSLRCRSGRSGRSARVAGRRARSLPSR